MASKIAMKGRIPDYGSLRNWRQRFDKSVVVFEGKPFFIQNVGFQKDPVLLKKYTDLQEKRDSVSNDEEWLRLTNKMNAINLKMERAKKDISFNGYILDGKRSRKIKTIDVSASDSTLDIKPFSVGFINSKTGSGKTPSAYYVSRVPARQNRQGLNSNNVRVIPLLNPNNIGPRDIIQSSGFVDAFYGRYPTLSEALDTAFASEEDSSVAFCSDYAISVDVTGIARMYHRSTPIAVSHDNGESFTFMGRYKYHYEPLTELGVNVNVR